MSVIMEGLNESYVEKIKEKYGDRFETVAKFFPGFNDEKSMKLGILLENTDEAFARCGMNESTQVNPNIIQGLKNQYFDIISASFPGLIAEELFSVQPLRQKAGQIFWMRYLYGKDKGRIKRGDTIFGPKGEIAGYENRNYTSETVEDEIIFTADGSETQHEGNLSYIPVLPGCVKFKATEGEITDDARGNLIMGGSKVGTIDYESGKYSFTATLAEQDVYADYEFDLSYAPSTIPEIELKVTDTLIQARPRKLRGSYSLDAAYDLKMAQGIDIQESLLEAAAMTLRHETDGELLMDALRQAGSAVTFNAQYNNVGAEIGIREFYISFLDCIVKASSIIRKKTKRVEANWLVVGKQAADMLRVIGAPQFVAVNSSSQAGPCLIGTLQGQWKVYINPFFADDEFLLGYKGTSLVDAGLVYAPYMPFFATNPIMLDDFLGRQGFATTYGKKTVNPDLYVRGKIINQ